ncbi:MAG: TlpA family protein disulfide reductase, partial [Pseudomonas sp.]|nr:TlpA family protein disulfide reductase [Pseudomonas sp.]
WLLINYWAEWCGPCRKEIPEPNRLAQHPQAAVQVLGVNYDGVQGEALARQSQALGIEFRVLAEDPAERLQLPRSQALPVTFIVDPQGRLRKQLVGEQTEQGLLGVLAELREQP